jgi:hypothetical protein
MKLRNADSGSAATFLQISEEAGSLDTTELK